MSEHLTEQFYADTWCRVVSSESCECIASAIVTLLQKLHDVHHDSDTDISSAYESVDDTNTTSPPEPVDNCHLGSQYVIDTETGTNNIMSSVCVL